MGVFSGLVCSGGQRAGNSFPSGRPPPTGLRYLSVWPCRGWRHGWALRQGSKEQLLNALHRGLQCALHHVCLINAPTHLC